jgi:thimet oligopeptidase
VKGLQDKYSAFHQVPGTSMQTGFGHLNGYSAIYYTYMWSQVIAKDLFSKFDQNNLLDPRWPWPTARRSSIRADPSGGRAGEGLPRAGFRFESYEKWLNSN